MILLRGNIQNFTKVELEKLTVNYYSIYVARIVRDFIIQKKISRKEIEKNALR